MGELMYGCTFPGRMISSVSAVRFGDTTDTAGTAACTVSARRVAPAFIRDHIPEPNRAATAITAIARTIQVLRDRFPIPALLTGGIGSPVRGLSSVCGNIK